MNLKIDELGAYTRFPERLKEIDPALKDLEKPDEFGMIDRLNAIKQYWPAPGGKAIDLGGNSGFFSLSLVDAGLLTSSIVYDADKKALEAGKEMASRMGLSDKVQFVEQDISLRFVKAMKPVDTSICLNLIHHAGSVFDIEEVEKHGWQAYAEEWLSELRRLSSLSILGIGFKSKKPAKWNVQKKERPRIFREMAIGQGWTPIYDANVQDIHTFGIKEANGRRSKQQRTLLHKAGHRLKNILTGSNDGNKSKRKKYHLYMMKS